jgi:phage tail protein X
MTFKEYSTVSGDQWDLISYKVYGNEYYIDQLVEYNIDHIRTVFFDAGIRLKVPDIAIPIRISTNSWTDIIKYT